MHIVSELYGIVLIFIIVYRKSSTEILYNVFYTVYCKDIPHTFCLGHLHTFRQVGERCIRLANMYDCLLDWGSLLEIAEWYIRYIRLRCHPPNKSLMNVFHFVIIKCIWIICKDQQKLTI